MFIKRLKTLKLTISLDMKTAGYSEGYIKGMSTFIDEVIRNAKTSTSYLDYYNNVILVKDIKPISKEAILWKLNFLKQYDETSTFPKNGRCIVNVLNKKSCYNKLNSEYQKVIDDYVEIETKNLKKESTILNEKRNASKFLMCLQNSGINSIDEITEKDIIGYFLNEEGNPKFSASLIGQIRIVLTKASQKDEMIKRILLFFPTIPNHRKNIQYLKKDEIESIVNVLNENNEVSLRDKAIVTLLLKTGLRGCDVRHLKLSDIDWKNERINIIQDKTNEPLELPLLTSVGNALFKYITEQRPQVNSEYIFLTHDFTHKPLTTSAVASAVNNVMNAANIRMTNGERHGTHLFRYNIAIAMLEKDTAQPVISQTLGHSSPSSLESYLNADLKHLKEMAISIDEYPCLLKGVDSL